MKRLITFLSLLGWLLILYWGLTPSLFSDPTGLFGRFLPERVMPEALGAEKQPDP